MANEISWKFNPETGSNFGGVERGVRSVKDHLKKILRDHHLDYEEFITLLIQVEAFLNSRPISVLGSDPNDVVDLLTFPDWSSFTCLARN